MTGFNVPGERGADGDAHPSDRARKHAPGSTCHSKRFTQAPVRHTGAIVSLLQQQVSLQETLLSASLRYREGILKECSGVERAEKMLSLIRARKFITVFNFH